jgi:hypothetical protein
MPLSCNLGTLTSWNPLGHSRPVTGLLYLYIYLLLEYGIIRLSRNVGSWLPNYVFNTPEEWRSRSHRCISLKSRKPRLIIQTRVCEHAMRFVTLGALNNFSRYPFYTGRFIMYSGIKKIYYRKTVGHVFTKPVQIEGTTQKNLSPVSCFSS